MPLPDNIFFADITKTDLVSLLNQSRQAAGLSPLTDNSQLDQAAALKAQNMVADGYFAHTSPQGITPWYWFLQAGYQYKYAGENLAVGFFNSTDVFNAWLNSPEHKANLLDPNYTQVGTAIVTGFGGNNATIVVQDFGSPGVVTTSAVKKTNPVATIPTQPAAPATVPQPRLATIAPIPPAATVNSAPAVLPSAQVLGKATQLAEPASVQVRPDNFYSEFINFMAYDYQYLILYLAYLFLPLICALLLINILVNINVQRGRVIARGLVLVAVLCFAIFLNQNLIIQIIPHLVII